MINFTDFFFLTQFWQFSEFLPLFNFPNFFLFFICSSEFFDYFQFPGIFSSIFGILHNFVGFYVFFTSFNFPDFFMNPYRISFAVTVITQLTNKDWDSIWTNPMNLNECWNPKTRKKMKKRKKIVEQKSRNFFLQFRNKDFTIF